MKIDESAKENPWLVDSVSESELQAEKHIAQIAAELQLRRKSRGWTQKELADRLGVSQSMVSRWENGEENFTVVTLTKLAMAFDVPFKNPLSA